MSYDIFVEFNFEQEFNKLDKAKQNRALKIREKLKSNPYTGKPLGYDWFREKRLNGERIYYLIYEDLKAILFVALGDKKTQQPTINAIKSLLDEYKEKIKKFKPTV